MATVTGTAPPSEFFKVFQRFFSHAKITNSETRNLKRQVPQIKRTRHMWTKPARRRFRDMFVACNNPRERNLLILQLFAALWIAKVSWHFVAWNILRGLNFVTSLILREDWRDRRPSQIPPACGASAYHRAWRFFLVDVAPRCRASGAYFRLPIFCAGTHPAIASMARWIRHSGKHKFH